MSGHGRPRKARLGRDAHRAGSSARKTQTVYPQGNISRKRGIAQGATLMAPLPVGSLEAK
ncbi:TPA: hypothetical protein PXP53_003200 [Yersinia enterocolitica]|nr:hypothetical protein [Yersinia enterocolitica]HEM6616122.1 hypothetical protein [Yersinia enterocolitica]